METENISELSVGSIEKQRRSSDKPILINSNQNFSNGEGGLDLGQLLSLFRRRLPIIIGVTATTMVLVYLWAKLHPKSYQSEFDVLIQSSTPESQLASSTSQSTAQTDPDPSSGRNYTLKGDSTLIKILTSPKLLLPVVSSLKYKYPNISYGSLYENLKLENVKETDILKVSYTGLDSNEVGDVIQLISQSYLKYSLDSRQADIMQARRFVDSQLPAIQNRVNYLQTQLQMLRQTYSLSDPNSQSQELSNQIYSLQQKQSETNAALKEAWASYVDLSNQKSKNPTSDNIASAALIENANYQKVRGQILDLDNQIAKESSELADDNPKLVALKEQRQLLIPILEGEANRGLQETASKIRILAARQQAFNDTGKTLNVNINQMAMLIRKYNDLQRDLQIATQNLTQFLTKRQALSIEAAQKQVPWELTTPPTQPAPVLMGTPTLLVLGGMMGILLGLGIALIYDKARNVFYTPDELKNETNLPLIGTIPYNSEVIKGSQYFLDPFFVEAYRTLYTNIRLFNIDWPIHSLTISSVSPNDGKTTVSVQLARMAASQGQKVLLVDLDLRDPNIHQRLGLSNYQGLSDLMTEEIDYHHIVQQVSPEVNLYVLTAGQIPADPLRILSSEKIKHLMAKFHSEFDLVIYDTPPALDLVDATLVATNTDGMALVVGLGTTDQSSFAQVLESISSSPAVIVGVIANRFQGISRKGFYQHSGSSNEPTPSQMSRSN